MLLLFSPGALSGYDEAAYKKESQVFENILPKLGVDDQQKRFTKSLTTGLISPWSWEQCDQAAEIALYQSIQQHPWFAKLDAQPIHEPRFAFGTGLRIHVGLVAL